jgi:hypothetical protein
MATDVTLRELVRSSLASAAAIYSSAAIGGAIVALAIGPFLYSKTTAPVPQPVSPRPPIQQLLPEPPPVPRAPIEKRVEEIEAVIANLRGEIEHLRGEAARARTVAELSRQMLVQRSAEVATERKGRSQTTTAVADRKTLWSTLFSPEMENEESAALETDRKGVVSARAPRN